MPETLLPIVGPDAHSDEWHALRQFVADRDPAVVMGATDAAACCGVSPYRTPLDVYVEKMTGSRVVENEAMRMGKRLEPIILDEYEARRQVRLARGLPMYLHAEYRWMGATPDALAVSDGGVWLYGVDAKSTTYRRLDRHGEDPLKFGAEGTDQMPIDYVLQAQQQCEVMGLPCVEFPVLFDARTLRIYRVERNEDLIAAIIKAEREMVERLVSNDPPEPDWSHENTRELIGLLYRERPGVTVELDEDDECRWRQIERYKAEIKAREACVTEETNRLLARLEGAEYGVFPSHLEQLKRVSVRETLVTTKDVEELAARVGQTKRKGYSFLRQSKIRE